jgi:hypothetical protein
MSAELLDTHAGAQPTREDRRNLCDFYRAELLGLVLEHAAGDERVSALVFAVLVSERIARLAIDRCWS